MFHAWNARDFLRAWELEFLLRMQKVPEFFDVGSTNCKVSNCQSYRVGYASKLDVQATQRQSLSSSKSNSATPFVRPPRLQ